jgi:hypothetical protein
MYRSIRRVGLPGALLTAALVVGACGGATGSTTPTDAASTAPESVAPSADVASPQPSTAIALPSFDLSGMLESLEGIDSYRVAITAGGEPVYTATVVTKPVLARDITASGQRIVIIGDEAWVDSGSGFTTVDPSMAQAIFGLYDPAVLIGAFAQPGVMTGADEVGIEEKNGVQARHFRVDASSMIGAVASMPPGSAVDIWVAEDGGYLVSMAVSGLAEGDFSMDVTNVNDPANVVERPA